MQRYRGIVVSALSCLALTACAGGTGYSADLNGASVPAGLERFYAQRLGWGSCAPFATTDAERAVYAMPFLLDCARLEVPLDYAAPHGRTAQLGVLRQKSPVKKIGSLVINPGGPGVSGMNAVVTSRMQPLANGPFDVAVERERRARQVAPFADSGGPAVGALDMCAFLPVHPTSTPHAPKFDGLPPTLTVSTTGDPATPYPGGVALANALRGGLITVDGHQHTAFLSSACVDEHVVRYLRTVQLPPVGAQCAL